MLIPIPSASSRSFWGMVIRLNKYCSEVMSSLMQLGSQLQSIQCGGCNFLLDIFLFPSFLYVYDTRPYHQSFLKGHFDHQDLHLIYIQLIQGDIPYRTTFPFVSCSLSPESEPFIIIHSSSDYSYFRLRPKVLYKNLGPYLYNSPSKFRFFPLIRGEKVGF